MTITMSEEELDVFLKEAGILGAAPQSTSAESKNLPLEQILEQIMETSRSPATSSLLTYPPQEHCPLPREKKKKRRILSFFTLWLSFVFLAGIFLGGILGFYWGKKQQQIVTAPSEYEEINEKLSLIIKDIQEMHQNLTRQLESKEVIEPLEDPNPMELLAPRALL